MRELLAARERPVVQQVALNETRAAADRLAVVITITGSGGITLPKMSFSGQGSVQSPPRGLAERSLAQILALVLVAIGTAALLRVPGPDQAAVGYDLAVLGLP